MKIKIEEWESLLEEVGEAYKFKLDGKFHAILETREGYYRGNHIHPNRQHTLLLSGTGRYIIQRERDLIEKHLVPGEFLSVDAGVPHILIPDTDLVTFEWWEGDFISEPCENIFNNYTENRLGDEDFKKRE
ncbi:MAG: hypothetical protein ACLFVP_09370 [Candidatus Bathyarchaeia archaeon]